jgi:Icc-related predicted phosphoesterase
MRFVAISDTHGQHHQLSLPAGDVLLHAGDMSSRGKEAEVKDFLNWMASQPHPHKILIAGNHDFFFEKSTPEKINQIIPPGIIYLNDSGITVTGIRIWGSPITPWFYNWAFNRHRGEVIARHWALIPADTHLLVTHGPAAGILDRTTNGQHAGCNNLLSTIQQHQPLVHVCGHIHEAYGRQQQSPTLFINASVLNQHYQLVNAPQVFELSAS